MSEATPPFAPLVALYFDLRPRTELDPPSDHTTVAECHFQREGEPLTSFDAEQLPNLAKQIMGELVAAQATTLTTQAQQLSVQAAEMQAKDANAQSLLAEIARLRAVVDTFSAEISSTVPHEEPKGQALEQGANLEPME